MGTFCTPKVGYKFTYSQIGTPPKERPSFTKSVHWTLGFIKHHTMMSTKSIYKGVFNRLNPLMFSVLVPVYPYVCSSWIGSNSELFPHSQFVPFYFPQSPSFPVHIVVPPYSFRNDFYKSSNTLMFIPITIYLWTSHLVFMVEHLIPLTPSLLIGLLSYHRSRVMTVHKTLWFFYYWVKD